MLAVASTKGEEKLNYEYKNPHAGDLAGNTKITYRVRSGDNLGSIAQKHGVSVRDVKTWNNLRSSTIHPGQRLSIYIVGVHKNGPTVQAAPKEVQKVITIAEGEKRNHVVKKGEFLGSIATMYDVSVGQLRSWNGISGNLIKEGQTLVIYDKTKQIATETKAVEKAEQPTKTHTVAAGEGLYNIALKNKMTLVELKTLNNLTSDNINVGQKLQVYNATEASNSTPKTYTVKVGDSLWSISKKFDVTVESIKKNNNLVSDDLKSGQILKID